MAEIQIVGCDWNDTIAYTNQMVDIIHSYDVKEAEIIVLPEAILNNDTTSIFLPSSTIFCNDPDAHFIFRNISCAARDAKKYVVINVYTKIKCSDDNQPFCANKTDNTNVYNMAFVFDRHGATIAKYVKKHFHLIQTINGFINTISDTENSIQLAKKCKRPCSPN